ncbi:hypothetical protein MP228_005210 [Amoeboaphelidium protococcarum]|nr:hypothetical protein MP228_005210 [Amoeboaphelidium protococcarum]
MNDDSAVMKEIESHALQLASIEGSGEARLLIFRDYIRGEFRNRGIYFDQVSQPVIAQIAPIIRKNNEPLPIIILSATYGSLNKNSVFGTALLLTLANHLHMESVKQVSQLQCEVWFVFKRAREYDNTLGLSEFQIFASYLSLKTRAQIIGVFDIQNIGQSSSDNFPVVFNNVKSQKALKLLHSFTSASQTFNLQPFWLQNEELFYYKFSDRSEFLKSELFEVFRACLKPPVHPTQALSLLEHKTDLFRQEMSNLPAIAVNDGSFSENDLSESKFHIGNYQLLTLRSLMLALMFTIVDEEVQFNLV